MLQPEDYDFISNFSTLWAVFLGAILATVGGFAATQIEWFFERRRRERNAALFFGEVLSTLTVLLRIANDTRGRGDPYGPLTMRILRTARREIDIYDRNRESLLDLRDSDIRARIHTLTLRIAMPIDNIFDATQELSVVLNQLRSNTLTDAEKAELEGRVATIRTSRDSGFDFAIEEAESLQTIIAKLEPIARASFKNIETIART
ncbi:MAG TPA: hypothetical protein VGG10_16870 [Rhizomicrobium sp.]